MGLSAGVRLGPYEIVAPLGAGGMGEVYRARDTRLGRDVAVKVVHPRLASDPERLSRFEKEARAAAQLDHPNILVVHDVGTHEGSPFIVSELLQGESLREKLGAPLPPKKAVEYAIQIARGLAAAHEKGIVHRDIKPENVFVTKDGHVKILDFGVAKLLPRLDASGADTQTPTESVTQPGTAVGTVAYMSPEQVRGQTVDARSDLFSLGVLLYEMLSGRRPFLQDTAPEILTAILREEPPSLSGTGRAIAPALQEIVSRCLEKQADDRFYTAHDVALALRAVAGTGEVSTAPAVAPLAQGRRRRLLFVGLAVAAAAVLIGLLFGTRFLRTASPPSSPVRLSLSFPLDSVPSLTANFNPFALSPDGKTLVYAGSAGSGGSRLFVRRLDRDETKLLPGTEGAVTPFFSPDGLWVGFFAAGTLKKVSLEGGPPITLRDVKESARGQPQGAGSWGVDGTIVFRAGGYSGLQRIPAAGGESRELTTVDAASRESHGFPQILPDGEHVLFQISKLGLKWSQAAVVSLRTGQQHIIVEDAACPRYLPSGHVVFTRGGSLHAAPFSLKRLDVSGLAVPVLDDLVTNRNWSEAAHMAFSSEGTLVYASSGQLQRTLVWVDRKGAAEPLPFPPGNYLEAALSPDGGRLAVIAIEKGETMALLIGELARGTLTRSPAEGIFQNLAWAPDGKRVAVGFVANEGTGPMRPHWFGADGSSPNEPLAIDAERLSALPASVSPEGSVLLFVGQDTAEVGPSSTGFDIYALPLSGERKIYPFLQTRFYEGGARFSPDGRWVAYHSNESGRPGVYVRPFPGPGPVWQISAEGGFQPHWFQSGRELFYKNGDKMMAVDVETKPTFRAGRPHLLFDAPFLRPYDVDSDRKRFLMIRSDPLESGPPRVNIVLNWFEEVKRRVPGAK